MVNKQKDNFSWTKSNIFKLIEKYKENECLWNINHDEYKCREKREGATLKICYNLGISREQFSKKIHNLRNQFNYESKKEQNRNNAEDSENSKGYFTKWEYFSHLKFLQNVIAPRPGFSSSNLSNYKFNKHSEDEICDNLSLSEKSLMEQMHVTVLPSNNDNDDKKSTLIIKNDKHSDEHNIATSFSIIEDRITTNCNKNDENSHSIIENQIDHNSFDGQIIEIQQPLSKRTRLEGGSSLSSRNEYDIFGEFVAGELKSLTNNKLKKKLKRKIMEAILAVENEDDD